MSQPIDDSSANYPPGAGHIEEVDAVGMPTDELPTDAFLWQQAADGDPSAFGALFERHSDRVYNHCFRRTGSWSAAEDLTSVVFLETWRKRKEVRLADDSLLPWLLAVANNVVRNRDRGLRRHRRLLAKLPNAVVVPDPSEDAVTRIDDERTMGAVLAVFHRLVPDEQDVLALCVWAHLSYTDTAIALGVPVGTVRSRLARAREHLRKLAGSELDAGQTGGPASGSEPVIEQSVRPEHTDRETEGE